MQVFLTAIGGQNRHLASEQESKRNSCPKMPIIQKAYVKNRFTKNCTPSRGCSLFPGGVWSAFPASSYQILRGAVAKWGAMHPSSLILGPFFPRKGERTQIAGAQVRASTDCTSLRGHAKAKEWYVVSMRCSVMATPIFHHGFSSHVVFIYIFSSLLQWIVWTGVVLCLEPPTGSNVVLILQMLCLLYCV